MLKHLPGLLIALVTLTSAADAQPLRFWVGGGLGASRDDRGVGPAARADVRVALGNLVVAGRLTANYGGDSGYTSRYNLGGDEAARDYYSESAILVGYAPYRSRRLQFVFEAGPASVKMNRVVGYRQSRGSCVGFFCSDDGGVESEEVTLMGLAAEVGLYGQFSRFVGYGLILHGNVNREQSFAGATVGLTLGKLR